MHARFSHTPHSTQPCPRGRVRVRLPLATVEEIDRLAELTLNSRQGVLRQLITVALISDTPLQPSGPEPYARLRLHAELTRIRSHELADPGALA
jgi:hypothetical protein